MHTHSDRLERWLGAQQVARVSAAMRDFYWPIAMHGVPGAVYAMPGGDFRGEIRDGQEMSAVDRAADYLRRERRRHVTRIGHMKRQAGAFGSLSALIAAATGGKRQDFILNKAGPTANAGAQSVDLWTATGSPTTGSPGAAAPGGTAYTSASAGAFSYVNPANANSGHFVTGNIAATLGGSTALLYDRLFAVAKTMNSTATEAVTGVPTRYQNTVAGTEDYIGGNFCYAVNPTTVLPATAHNWTVCQYTDQAGNAAQNFVSIAGQSACAVRCFDLQAGFWFLPLAAGDVGVKALTQMQCSALVATGTIEFVIGHPIAFMPCPIANLICPTDGINTAFNLTRIYDNAALGLIDFQKPATSANTFNGQITVVAE